MDFLELTLPTPEANLALDEALLLEAEAGRDGEVLRLWELPTYAVILGSAGRRLEEAYEAGCRADEVPILRRCSGGGAVLLGPGCLCYSLVLSFERPAMHDVTHSYALIMSIIGAALNAAATEVSRLGTSDLVVATRKISGNAQRRMSSFVLHHGTILYNFELPRIGRYLPLPQRQPAYRRGRGHEEFLANSVFTRDEISLRLRRAWQADSERLQWPRDLVTRLVREKYGQPEWTQRR